jgi:RNA polymerase sigma factor (sigma-70 family)
MAAGQIHDVLRHLRRLGFQQDAGYTDGQLLEFFLARREEAAFEALVRRHGPMVLGVCRRILRDPHDAEDAFQATFVVLVRKAASFIRRETVGNWLYGVAYHTALKARAAAAKRRAKERRGGQMRKHEALPEEVWDEVQPLLDQELHRLPDKYRTAVILCDLEGKTRREAARQLGWPEGTLSCRLARARILLAKRLTRYGFGLSGGLLGMALSQNGVAASLPLPLVNATVQAAGSATFRLGGTLAGEFISARVANLSEGVLKGMLLSKLKIATALVLSVCVAGLVLAAAAMQPLAVDRPNKKADGDNKPEDRPQAKRAETLRLPTGPAPVQVLVRLDARGQLAVRSAITKYRQVQGLDATGQKVTVWLAEAGTKTQRYDPEDIRVFDTVGKRVDSKALAKLIPREIPALASVNGKKVDPLHLRLIKERTLVLVLPQPKPPAPAKMPGGGGMPGGALPPAVGPGPGARPAGGGGGMPPPVRPPQGGGPGIGPPAKIGQPLGEKPDSPPVQRGGSPDLPPQTGKP